MKNLLASLNKIAKRSGLIQNRILMIFLFKIYCFIFKPLPFTKKTLLDTKNFTNSYSIKEVENFQKLDKYLKEWKSTNPNYPNGFQEEILRLCPPEFKIDAPKTKKIKIGKTIFMISLSGYKDAPLNTKRKIDRISLLAKEKGLDFILITKKNILDYVVIPNQYKEIVNNFLSSDVKSTPSNHWSRAKDKDYLLALTFLGSYAWSGTYLNMKYGGICVNDTIIFKQNATIKGENTISYILDQRYFSPSEGEWPSKNTFRPVPFDTSLNGKWSLELNSSNSSFHPIFTFKTILLFKLFLDPNISKEDKIFYNQNYYIDFLEQVAYEKLGICKYDIDENSKLTNKYFHSMNIFDESSLFSKKEFDEIFKDSYAVRIDDRYNNDEEKVGSKHIGEKYKKSAQEWFYSEK